MVPKPRNPSHRALMTGKPSTGRTPGAFRLQDLVLVPIRGTPTAFWISVWDTLHGLCIVCAAYFIPLDIALAVRTMLLWRIVSVFLNAVFSFDMVLRFLLAYRIPRHSMDMTLAAWETRPSKIARFYCGFPGTHEGRGGMFWPDLLATTTGWASIIEGSGGIYGEVGRFWRVACFFRTFQLLHLNSITGLLDESWVHYGQSQAIVQVIKFVLVATLACHWAACMWLCVEDVVLQPPDSRDSVSWLSRFLVEHGDPCEPSAAEDGLCVYVLASYWAMMTVTGVGYGDIVPTDKLEYMVATMFMLCAGFVWAYIVGAVVSLLQSSHAHTMEFRQKSDDLNCFVKEQNVPKEIQRKLRRFILESRHIRYQRAQRECMKEYVSKGLQGRVSEVNPITTLFKETVFWAKDLQAEALLAVVRALEPACYAASEVIPMNRRMIVIREGVLFASLKVLTRGSVHGEAQMLLESAWLADRQFPYTLSHVDILYLTHEALKEVCMQDREAGIRIRRAQIRTAVWRGFVRAAQQLEEIAAQESEQKEFQEQASVASVKNMHRRASTPAAFGEADDMNFRRSINYLKDPSMTRMLDVTSTKGMDPMMSNADLSGLELRILEQVTSSIKGTFSLLRGRSESVAGSDCCFSGPSSPKGLTSLRTRSLTAGVSETA